MEETLRSLKLLIAEGFEVMVYCTDDPVYARKLEDAGAVAIMPLGAPIGSGLGHAEPHQHSPDRRAVVRCRCWWTRAWARRRTRRWPWSWAATAVLMNTAIAEAREPIRMARAMKHAVIAGREAYLAGRMKKRMYADPSSPLAGLI